jgi:2,3-dihydroxybenzoate decarboxylase
MQGKVTLEDHFAIAETLNPPTGFTPEVWSVLKPRLLDIQDQRLRLMDASDVEMMIISLNSPAVQAIHDVRLATETARKANDLLADQVQKHPDRFAAVAALPMQDPEAAVNELQRCVRELGFKGALVNGFSQLGTPDKAMYLDLPMYRPFWRAVESLGLPFYLHPRNPMPDQPLSFDGHPWLLGATWGFHAETAVHALRLIGSGLFDEHPRLAIVLGHLGEGLPFYLWRIDNRNKWMNKPHKYPAKKPVADYLRANFHVTTSGHFSTPALLDTIAELGSDRVMFSVDYPFEAIDQAAEWFDAAPIGEADRLKIGRTNAVDLFKLKMT